MEYTVEPTELTPKVRFDAKTGEFELSGKSFWENADTFYSPILKWLEDKYVPSPAVHTRLTIQLDYFNTASAKALLGIYSLLERVHKAGKKVDVIWRYNELDEDLEEAGEDYRNLTSLNIILESFKDDDI